MSDLPSMAKKSPVPHALRDLVADITDAFFRAIGGDGPRDAGAYREVIREHLR